MTDGGPGARDTLVIFDGACDLCSGAARFISRRDRRGRLHLIDAGSAEGRGLLFRYGYNPDRLDTLVVIDRGRAYARSTAALRIAGRLPWPWPALCGLKYLPRPFRDFGYDVVARNRYCVFGAARCEIPDRARIKKSGE